MSVSDSSNLSSRKAMLDLFDAFHTARSKTKAERIVDIAKPADVTQIRSWAVPTADGGNLEETIDEALKIFSHRVAMDDPRFFGFIPGPVHDSAYLGDIMTSMFNTHAGSWYQSSGPSSVEDTLIEWLADQVGLPSASSGGVFVSGGSMANLTGIVLARDTKMKYEDRSRARIYVSEQTHSSVQKGLGIAGFHPDQTHVVPCDEDYRVRTDSLRCAIKRDRDAGLVPFLIVATCGFTNTGGIDPLNDLADIAQEEDLWLHVDGAYGASVLLSKSHKHCARGIERAHSLSWDAHKWLFQTYACGVLLVRDKSMLVKSFSTNASYIQDADEISTSHVNFWNRGIELTRPARSMKLWFTLRLLGTDKIGEMIDHGIALAETAEATLRARKNWRLVTPAKLGNVSFRFVASGLSSGSADDERLCEQLNVEISRRAIEQNIAAPLTTRLKGKLCLRMCSIHPALSLEQMEGIIDALDKLAEDVVARHSL